MNLDEVKEFLRNALYFNLIMESPVLSGSMQYHIQMGYGADGYEIIIEAPFYDSARWQKDKVLVYTGESKNGVTDYAYDVNESGAFGRHNKSEHWVNRCINNVCREVALKYNGVVEGELER